MVDEDVALQSDNDEHEIEGENGAADEEVFNVSVVPADDDLVELEPVHLGARPREPAEIVPERNEYGRQDHIPLSPAQWDAVQQASRDNRDSQRMEAPLLPLLEARPVLHVADNDDTVGTYSEGINFIL